MEGEKGNSAKKVALQAPENDDEPKGEKFRQKAMTRQSQVPTAVNKNSE